MNTRLAVPILLAANFALQACATTTPGVSNDVPSWMKYEVTGSRIRRPLGPRGQPETGDPVTHTTYDGLLRLPSVTIRQ